MLRISSFALLLSMLLLAGCAERQMLGSKTASGVLTENATSIRSAGRVIRLKSKPVDLSVSPDGKWVLVKDNATVKVFDAAAEKQVASLSISGGGSQVGVVAMADQKLLVTTAKSAMIQAEWAEGSGKVSRTVGFGAPKAGGESYPQGIAISPTRTHALVALNRSNTVGWVDLISGKVEREVPVGVAPYAVARNSSGSRYVVTNWSEFPSADAERTSDASGTKVPVDERGIAIRGELVVLDSDLKVTGRVPIGRQATSAVFLNDELVVVACANEGTLEVIDAKSNKVVSKNRVRGLPGDTASVQPSGLAFDSKRGLLAAVLSGRDGVALFGVNGGKLTQKGVISTGSYPTGVAFVGEKMVVCTSKGTGPQSEPAPKGGYSVYQFAGSVEWFDVPTDAKLADLTKEYFARQAPLSNVNKLPFETNGKMPIEHVVYVLKENRTYDQIFGDMPEGDGEPRFCIFGEKITPNHHALAREFGLLDNFYCNGVNSADGHSWAMEGNETTYQERAQGGWTRSYPYGDDPLAISSTGHVWDAVLAANKTFRNFGEFDTATEKPDTGYKQIFDDYQSGAGKIKIEHAIGIKKLLPYTNPDFPGWNMDIPDVLRASIFLKEFATYEQSGKMPNFSIVYLPQDHTSGSSPEDPTPETCVADNDLALGRVVDRISKSKFWAKTAIFVVEDDPQGGFDHVDGHRSPCLVISPYSKKGAVVSNFYNQTSVIRTMLHILGAKQLNDNTQRAPLMAEAFMAKPNLATYTVRPNQVPLDKLNPAKPKSKSQAEAYRLSQKLVLNKPDASDDDTLNRILWLNARPGIPYPAEWAGSHGRGLAARGLLFDLLKIDD